MLKLRTLGGLTLEATGTSLHSAALQRKRLALLAVIAAGQGGVSRDRLLSLLWPDRDQDGGRHALAQSVHALRRGLGESELFLGTQDVRLNPSAIEADIWEFGEALAAGELERAVGVYRGPFLDGVHLSGAPEFERWADAERSRLARRFADALAALAREAEARGDRPAAVKWWRALAAADPLAARPTLGLMRALTAAGERAAALQHARVYEAMLRADLEVEPDPEIVALAEDLRRQQGIAASRALETGSATASPGDTGGATSTAGRDAVREVTVPLGPMALRTDALTPGLLVDQPTPPTPYADDSAPAASEAVATSDSFTRNGSHGSSPRRGHRVPLAGAVTALLVVSVATYTASRAAEPERIGAANRIAVFPFAVRGDAQYAYLGDGMVDLLASALGGAGDLHAVDPRVMLARVMADPRSREDYDRAADVARELNAGQFVRGSITAASGRVQLSASLYDTRRPGEPVGIASGAADDSLLFQAVDRLAAQLLAAYDGKREGVAAARLTSVAAVTTSSMPALKAWLAGEQKLRQGSAAEALDAFQSAVTLDSTFALGYYRLSFAADWLGRVGLARSAAASAVRHAGRLTEHDRLLVQALLAWRQRDADEAERLYRSITQRYPDDVESSFQLGEVLFHDNPRRGRSFAEARAAFEQALRLEPDRRDARLHLLRIATWEQRWADANDLMQRLDSAGTIPEYAPLRMIAGNRSPEIDRAFERLRLDDAHALHARAVSLAAYTHRLDMARAVLALAADPARPRDERALAYRGLQQIAAARGRLREARAYADSLRAISPLEGLEAQARLALVPLPTYDAAALKHLLDELRSRTDFVAAPPVDSTRPVDPSYADRSVTFTVLAGWLSARQLDVAGVKDAAARVGRRSAALSDSARAWRAERSIHLRAAALVLDQQIPDALALLADVSQWNETGEASERFQRARVLELSGQIGEAIRWYGSFEQVGLDALQWAAVAHRERARLLVARGDDAGAAESYARVVELWGESDPELQPLVAEARNALAQLRRR